MKKILIVLTTAALLAGCAGTPANDEASKMQQLQEYKQQLSELKQKIDQLEKELAATEKNEAVKVTVAELTPQLFEHFIEVNGTVEADQDVNVSPESVGVIENILAKEGQQVTKGQPLAILNTETLQRSMDEMKVQLELATTTYNRQKNLWDQKIGSEMQLLQAKSNMEALQKRVESLQAQKDLSVVKAPVNGVVDIIFQKKGEIGSPQTPFAKVINIDNIKVYADIAETYITKIKQGDRAVVKFPALGKDVPVPVFRIGNVVDPNNRTFRIRLNLNNPDRMIKPNLISIVQLRDYAAENAIVVPTILIKEDFKGNYTFVVDKTDGTPRAKKVYVKPGINNNNMSEIQEGLTAGTLIITEGYTQVVDGSPLQY